ncbi:MAG: adenylate/guanylate cyclase domain-containing protein [Micrococcales bacterium]|nr:adenylate/guanylate cyclase domain-containing protein [Micrococcales bacterium]
MSGDRPGAGGDDYIEQLLGKPLRLRRRDVSTGAEVSLLSARKFWHALGFPVMETDDEVFTDADRDALRAVAAIVREGLLDEPTALAMTRAFARTTERLAGWQSQLIAEAVEDEWQQAEDPDATETRAIPRAATANETAARLVQLADRMEPLLLYAWRRHLGATVARMLADSDPESYGLTAVRSVGFADLVHFTSLVRKLSERDLGRLVSRFEALSSDVITAHGGRLVKTVGDEVVFSTVGAAPAAAIALDLVDAMTEDELLPDVRCGMARGPIVSRLGDVFGTTVNRAARLTAVAPAGSVLVDATLARELATLSGFELHGQRRRVLRGVGAITPSALRRASPSGRRST